MVNDTDKSDTNKIVELDNQETEQVIGGASPNPAGTAGHTLTNSNNPFGGLEALRGGATVPPRRAAE